MMPTPVLREFARRLNRLPSESAEEAIGAATHDARRKKRSVVQQEGKYKSPSVSVRLLAMERNVP